MADIFDTIAKAKPSQGGTPISDGKYLFAVKNIILDQKHSGMMFIAELLVLESAPVDVGDNFRTPEQIGRPILPNSVGATVSYVINLTKNNESGPGNVKSFLLGITGQDNDKVDDTEFKQMIKEAIAPEQPLRGVLIRDTTFRKLIQKGANAGKPFTAHRWEHVPGQTDESIAAQRAKMEAGNTAAAAQ